MYILLYSLVCERCVPAGGGGDGLQGTGGPDIGVRPALDEVCPGQM